MAIQPTYQSTDRLGKALTIGGAVVGGIAGAGHPGAIMQGAGIGQTASGLLQRQPVQPIESQGMARRRDQLSQDPTMAINEARAALRAIPPDQLPETRRAFEQALAMAQRNQQIGRV